VEDYLTNTWELKGKHNHGNRFLSLCAMYITKKMIVLMKLFLLHVNLKICKLFGLS
jgi:hypothetical protein